MEEEQMDSYWDMQEGFLPSEPNKIFFDEALRPHFELYDLLPELIEDGTIADRLRALPVVDVVFAYEHYYDAASCLLLTRHADCESAFSLFAILASVFVHRDAQELRAARGEPPLPPTDSRPVLLPAGVAVPLKVLAERLGRLPIWDYAGCVLTNWTLADPSRDVSMENLRILRTVTRTRAEEWFYMVHVMVEFHGAAAVRAIAAVQQLAAAPASYEDDAELKRLARVAMHLRNLAGALRDMNDAQARMREHCHETEFFALVRPWLAGWPPAGVVYCTKDSQHVEPEMYTGGSGAQSSVMPCVDTFLGVAHGQPRPVAAVAPVAAEGTAAQPATAAATAAAATAPPAAPAATPANSAAAARDAQADAAADLAARRAFAANLQRYRKYMPPPHRARIAHLESAATARDMIADLERRQAALEARSREPSLPLAQSEHQLLQSLHLSARVTELKAAYNAALEQVVNFRRRHVGYAISYITSQAKRTARDLSASGAADAGARLLERSTQGTGGSHFRYHLMQHIKDSSACMYALPPAADAPPSAALDRVLPGVGRFMPPGSVFARSAAPPRGLHGGAAPAAAGLGALAALPKPPQA